MPDQTSETEIILKVRADQQSAALTAQALRQHQTDVNNTVNSYRTLQSEASRTASSVSSNAQRMSSAIHSSLKTEFDDVKSLTDVWKQYSDTVGKTPQVQPGGGGGGGDTGGGGLGGLGFLRRTGSTLSRLGLGDVGQPLMVVGEIAQVTKGFDKLGERAKPLINSLASVADESAPLTAAMGSLGGSMGIVLVAAVPVAVAVAGVAIAWKVFTDVLANNEKTLQSVMTVQENYYKVIQTGTTDTIKIQIAALQAQKDIIDKLANDARQALIKALQSQAGDVFSEVAAALAAKPFRDELDKQTKAAADLQAQIDALTKALDSATVAANDAADAAQKDANANRAKVKQQQEDAALSLAAAQQKLQAQKDLLQQEQAEYMALEASGDQSQKTKDRMAALIVEMQGLTDEIAYLTNDTIPAARGAENVTNSLVALKKEADAAAKSAKDLAEKQKADRLKSLQDAAAQIGKDEATLTDAYIKRADAIKKADESYAADKDKTTKDYNANEAASLIAKNEQIASINDNFMANEIKATQDFQAQETQANDQYAKQRMRAIEDLNDQLLDLAGRRDVAGFIQAQRAGEKNIARMAEDATDADKQRVADFAKQRQDAAVQRQIQLDDVQKNFEKEDRKRKDAYRDQLQALDEKHRAEKRAADVAFVQAISDLTNNYAGLKSIHDKYYADMNAAALAFVTTQKAYLQSLYGTGAGGGSSQSAAVPSIAAPIHTAVTSISRSAAQTALAVPRFASGGTVMHDGLVFAHAGERILRGVDNQGGGSPIVQIGSVNVGKFVTEPEMNQQLDGVVKAVAAGIRQGAMGGNG